ncbi:AcrR family transcriptional regulator [Kitasatospora gansuensis]|uniref:AcrR family transcriptional regulator n=1 Tax=Kitasatospora gansuensis TaxID=258050 RepID=A0A7W7SCL0_9ACTN|nr:TetR/AcrR family transcriptional regulator [Kitasatospora gansuensis]MBB4947995.1 AcrR family transcriptional regulator [Kitasatospora gansuensis]
MTGAVTDGRVQRGNETRRAVLSRAVEVASVEGLGSLSIGRLATDLGLSKSGVFAAFGSKEELQLATVRAARRIFYDAVIVPAEQAAPGLPRLRLLCESWLAYTQAKIFPGGCFFQSVSAEFNTRPGPIRDALAVAARDWEGLLVDLIRTARANGELAADVDPEQLAFTLIGLMETSNAHALLLDDPTRYARAATAIAYALSSAQSA